MEKVDLVDMLKRPASYSTSGETPDDGGSVTKGPVGIASFNLLWPGST